MNGNHFIEVALEETDPVRLFLRSGSGGVGNPIVQHHMRVAQKLCPKWWGALRAAELGEMMDRVIGQVSKCVGVPVEERTNCHHNVTESEEHFDKRA